MTQASSLRIGVLLPASGVAAEDWMNALDWARSNVAAAGNIGGHPIEFVPVDEAQGDPVAAGRMMAVDPSITAVIGPRDSGTLMAIAPAFVLAKKPIVSPVAGSVDVGRAVGQSGFVYRTGGSDVSQAAALVAIAAQRGAKAIATITAFGAYGNTFFGSSAFRATEVGIDDRRDYRYTPPTTGCWVPPAISASGLPAVLIAAPADARDAACLMETVAQLKVTSRVLMPDVAREPGAVAQTSAAAEGLEGTAPGSPPADFVTGYQQRYGNAPGLHAAATYDALLLLAYGLASTGGAGGQSLGSALAALTHVTGTPTQWDEAAIATSLSAIAAGTPVAIGGATGPLLFDAADPSVPAQSRWEHWRISNGAFQTVEQITKPASQAVSAAEADSLTGTALDRGPRAGLWALIAATSSGWDNYRHQADALAMYRVLKSRGVPDDRIVLVLADDIAKAAQNTAPGTVHHAVGGPDLRAGAQIDYHLDEIDAPGLLAILAGTSTAGPTTVLHSGAQDDVLLFLVGHGSAQGLALGATTAQDTYADGVMLTPTALAKTIGTMDRQHRYRRMLVAVETCHGGALGAKLRSPAVIFFAGARAAEDSIAVNFDPTLQTFLADEFADAFVSSAIGAPTASISTLYGAIYPQVTGSHVTAHNVVNFGDPSQVLLADFISP